MTVKITAIDSFSHGRLSMHRGESISVTAAEADDLEKVGLVTRAASAKAKADSDAQASDQPDPAAGEKMEAITHNKMDVEPQNKSTTKRK